MVTGDHSGHDDMERTLGDANERLGVGGTPGADGDEREDATNGPVLCGKNVDSGEGDGVAGDFLKPKQAKVTAVKEN